MDGLLTEVPYGKDPLYEHIDILRLRDVSSFEHFPSTDGDRTLPTSRSRPDTNPPSHRTLPIQELFPWESTLSVPFSVLQRFLGPLLPTCASCRPAPHPPSPHDCHAPRATLTDGTGRRADYCVCIPLPLDFRKAFPVTRPDRRSPTLGVTGRLSSVRRPTW